MTLNRVKLGLTATFMKYPARVVSVLFLLQNLTQNKTTFPASNSLNFPELVENKLMQSISEKIPFSSHQDSIYSIMNYQSSNFGGEGS